MIQLPSGDHEGCDAWRLWELSTITSMVSDATSNTPSVVLGPLKAILDESGENSGSNAPAVPESGVSVPVATSKRNRPSLFRWNTTLSPPSPRVPSPVGV